MTFVTRAVRVTPPRFTPTMSRTAAIATARSHPAGAAYAAKVRAIAAQPAILPTMKPHPDVKPHQDPSSAEP